MYNNKRIRDIVQFRLVLLNDDGTVNEILFESKEYEPCDGLTGQFSNDLYDCLLNFGAKYNFSNWEEVPTMEFQYRRLNSNEWRYYSDPIDDYMNL